MGKYLNPDLEKALRKKSAHTKIDGNKKGVYIVQDELTGDLFKFYDYTPAEIANIMVRMNSQCPYIVETDAVSYQSRSILCYSAEGKARLEKAGMSAQIL